MRIEIAIDVNDPELIIPFYRELLGYLPHDADNERYGTDNRYFSLVDPTGTGPKFIFQLVPETSSIKNRIHLDLHVSDLETQAERAVTLGAKRIDLLPVQEAGTEWIRLADPEGNIFCMVQDR